MKRLLLSLLCATSLLQAQEVRRALPVTEPSSPAPVVSDPNALASFLAGQPTAMFAAQQSDSFYHQYTAQMEKLRDRYFDNYFLKMRTWSAGELYPRLSMTRPVIYFFGGPDILSALAYYPGAPVYILGGLEPVGSIASPHSLTPAQIAEGLENLRKSTEVVLSYGHFITKDMKAELDRTAFRGVLPILSAFLALAQKQIVSTSYVGVLPDGSLREMGNSYTGGKGVLPGVKIEFRSADSPSVQTLYYIQANVSDDALPQDGGLLRWVGGFGSGNVYLKAASYLMHESYFSRIRKFLLTNDSVLQDDSGIPYRYFAEAGWRCWFFGTYDGTLDIFKKYQQADYQQAFQGGAQELPFGTGYKWRQGQSNLLLAIRPRAAVKPQ